MKKLMLYFLFLIVYNAPQVLAQERNEGVYINADDYAIGKLCYQSTQGKRYKLRIHTLINTATITIISSDTAITLLKNNVYGYRDKNKINYRFYNNIAYEIITTHQQHIVLYKTIVLTGNKGAQTMEKYFFSTTTNAPIHILTTQNLKNEFATNTWFIAGLDLYFKTDNELLNYDTFHQQYTLHYVYALTNQLSNQSLK
ncbi:MAG: hypothetical protein ABL940_02870 [Bacteroidia bacterium]